MSIGIVAKLHADALKVADQFARRKMGGAVEKHMFEEVGQALLRFGFMQTAGLDI